jgi:hypothetical protein
MKRILSLKTLAYLCIGCGFGLALWYLNQGGFLKGDPLTPAPEKVINIAPFMTGLVAPLLTLGGALLVIVNLINQTKQNFSNNFFNLLNQHHKLVDSISTVVEGISSSEKPSVKRDFFDDLCQRIAFDYNHLPLTDSTEDEQTPGYDHNGEGSLNVTARLDVLTSEVTMKLSVPKIVTVNGELTANKSIGITTETEQDKLKKVYNYYYHIHQSDLGHYFRNLYHIVSYADKQPFSYRFRYIHIKILRAQLSNYEILLLAYNGLSNYGEKFNLLIKKYKLLKNLNLEFNLPTEYERRIVDYINLVKAYPHLNETVVHQGQTPIDIAALPIKLRIKNWIDEKLS